MRILQVNNYAYLKGGSEKVFFETIKILEDFGHEVSSFSMANEKNREDINLKSVDVKPYEDRQGFRDTLKAVKNFFYNSNVAAEFEKLLLEFKPDIIHIHIVYGRLTNAIIGVARKHGVPVVQSVHEFRLLCPVYTCLDQQNNVCEKCADSHMNLHCILNKCSKGGFSNSVLVAAECKFRDWFYNYQKNVAGFIMVSEFIMDKHLQYFPRIKSKCHQVYNSLDTADYKKFVNLNKFNEERYYLYFGRLSYEKGIMTLLDYFDKHRNDKLKIAGTGPLADEIRKRIISSNLNNVELLGYQSGDGLYRLIANSLFTIVPSEWYENNPLTILESLSVGTPIIGNKIGGIPEIVMDKETGFVYDYKINGDFNRVMELAHSLSCSEYCSMMDKCIKEAQSRFDNTVHYENLMRVYKSILGECNSKKRV